MVIFRSASFFLGARFVALVARLFGICNLKTRISEEMPGSLPFSKHAHCREAFAISCSFRSSVARDTLTSTHAS